jgi:hypothetical protein
LPYFGCIAIAAGSEAGGKVPRTLTLATTSTAKICSAAIDRRKRRSKARSWVLRLSLGMMEKRLNSASAIMQRKKQTLTIKTWP